MIRINLVRGKRKKRREFNVDFAFLLVPVLFLAGTVYFHTTVTGKIARPRRANVSPRADRHTARGCMA